MILVSELIAAAQGHLREHGDTPVGVVVWDPHRRKGTEAVLCIEAATELGSDQYDEDGPLFFEIEAQVAGE
jgi:hypothetical protein